MVVAVKTMTRDIGDAWEYADFARVPRAMTRWHTITDKLFDLSMTTTRESRPRGLPYLMDRLAELRRRHAAAEKRGAGAPRTPAQEGKLSARERIDLLLE